MSETELIANARAEALREAADALELQPPMLKAQYVATLRLYADELWRLELDREHTFTARL